MSKDSNTGSLGLPLQVTGGTGIRVGVGAGWGWGVRRCGAAKGSKWVPLWSVLGQTRYQTPHPNSTLFGQCMTGVWWRVGSGAGKTAVAVCGHVTRKPIKTTPQSIMQQRCKRHSQTACTHLDEPVHTAEELDDVGT